MSNRFRNLYVLASGLILGVSLTIGTGAVAKRESANQIPLQDLRTFTDVFARIKTIM